MRKIFLKLFSGLIALASLLLILANTTATYAQFVPFVGTSGGGSSSSSQYTTKVNQGYADTALYTKADGRNCYVTLDDLQDYYLDNKSFKIKQHPRLKAVESKYQNYWVSGDTMAVKGNDPIISFIDPIFFNRVGDAIFLGDEYGFYIHTVKGIHKEGFKNSFKDGEVFCSQVYLFDIDYKIEQSVNNKALVFEVKLVVNNLFVTLSKNALNRKDNIVGVYCNDLCHSRYDFYRLDDDASLKNDFITVPMYPNFVTDTVDEFFLFKSNAIQLYTPKLRVDVEGTNIGDLILETSPSYLNQYSSVDDVNYAISKAIGGLSTAVGFLPEPYKYARPVISIGKVIYDKVVLPKRELANCDNQNINNLDSFVVSINAPSFGCDFDTAVREKNKHVSGLDNKMLIFGDCGRDDHLLFKVRTTMGNPSDLLLTFNCTFLWSEVETHVFYQTQKVLLATDYFKKRDFVVKCANGIIPNRTNCYVYIKSTC